MYNPEMEHLIPCRIHARAVINPSEDPERVLVSLLNILPTCSKQIRDNMAEAEDEGIDALDTIRKSLASRQSLGVLCRNMKTNSHEDNTRFLLNRQAAYARMAAVCDTPEESPLGPIEIVVKSRRIADVIEWMSGNSR